MLGFTDLLEDLIQSLRVRELGLSTKFRKLLCGRIFFGELAYTNAVGLPLPA